MTALPPHDLRAEEAVLGAVLLSSQTLYEYVVTEGLRPEHFYRPRHQAVFAAMRDLHGGGEPVDTITVTDQLARTGKLEDAGGHAAVEALTASPPDIASIRRYGQIVRDLSEWRDRTEAARGLLAACNTLNAGAVDEALTSLAFVDQGDENKRATGAQVTEQVLAHIEGKTEQARWKWPLHKLNVLTHGGLRPGQVTLVSGPTRHGKSVFVDEVLESCSKSGATCRLYLNEMRNAERGMRCAARGAQVQHEHIINGTVDQTAARRLMDWANSGGVPFEMQECDGWSAQDIARDLRHRPADVIAVDLLDELPLLSKMQRRETAEESMRVFKQLAMGAAVHVLVVAHLNRNRSANQAYIPMPALSDIRESGMLANRAHNVLFVWREQDHDSGDPVDEGVIRVAKARAGKLGSAQVLFDGDRQRFLPDDRPDLRSVA